ACAAAAIHRQNRRRRAQRKSRITTGAGVNLLLYLGLGGQMWPVANHRHNPIAPNGDQDMRLVIDGQWAVVLHVLLPLSGSARTSAITGEPMAWLRKAPGQPPFPKNGIAVQNSQDTPSAKTITPPCPATRLSSPSSPWGGPAKGGSRRARTRGGHSDQREKCRRQGNPGHLGRGQTDLWRRACGKAAD